MFQESMLGFFTFMRVAYNGDAYVGLPGGIKSIDWVASCHSPGHRDWVRADNGNSG